jgi:hypothetical protein
VIRPSHHAIRRGRLVEKLDKMRIGRPVDAQPVLIEQRFLAGPPMRPVLAFRAHEAPSAAGRRLVPRCKSSRIMTGKVSTPQSIISPRLRERLEVSGSGKKAWCDGTAGLRPACGRDARGTCANLRNEILVDRI